MRCSSLSFEARRVSADSVSSTSPSRPPPPTMRRRSPRLRWTRATSGLRPSPPACPPAAAAVLSACRLASAAALGNGGPERTQQSPSVHSSEPSGNSRPRKTSSPSVVDTESAPQISSSDSSPQCHRITASSMAQRGNESCLPTHSPSKPSALQTRKLSRAMPALTASRIFVSASTSSALSLRSPTTDFMSLASHSSHSFEATSIASPAEAVSRSCSFSRPRPCSDSRSRARVPE
mmetsp:Transcript_136454/g.380339  ORF Transcript_136454/g.380339 Transcript_136454/m.380339 type:complete len:235 (+) Transcript_136454:232-936(+)